MNSQRPLAAEGSVPASSQGGGDFKSAVQPVLLSGKKRPGPKRDSKPAPSEKLERNRQAQRTHRERKEQYTKDLELELSRLRELFVNTARERDAAHQARDEALKARDHLFEENKRLSEALQISKSASGTDSGYDCISVSDGDTRANSVSFSGGMPSFPSQLATPSTALMPQQQHQQQQQQQHVWEFSETRGFASDGAFQNTPPIKIESRETSAQSSSGTDMLHQPSGPAEIDYDELALDFVLTLERPCMGHLQYLTVRAHNFPQCPQSEMPGQPMEVPDDGENQHISGHALMATAPPYSHIQNHPGERYPNELPQVQREDLLRLLNLSSQLQVTEAELPPVRAWIKVMQHEKFRSLSPENFARLKATLARKVNCYRFGAVLDERDIADAMQDVLNIGNGPFATLPAAGSA